MVAAYLKYYIKHHKYFCYREYKIWNYLIAIRWPFRVLDEFSSLRSSVEILQVQPDLQSKTNISSPIYRSWWCIISYDSYVIFNLKYSSSYYIESRTELQPNGMIQLGSWIFSTVKWKHCLLIKSSNFGLTHVFDLE